MPKLWSETIEAHRRTVHDAILDTTAALVAEHGLLAVTMSQIAEKAGIGRATLYKYFPDVEAIVLAWHNRMVAAHGERLARAGDAADTPGERLEAVLRAYADIHYQRARHIKQMNHGEQLATFLHRDLTHIAPARQRLHGMIAERLAEAAGAGDIRRDINAEELAAYSMNALHAAAELSSADAVDRLVAVVLAGLRGG